MAEIIPFPRPQHPALRFQWKDMTDRFHYPDKMPTRHLYFVVAMIWNHSMPEEARTHNYKKYRFGPFYTPEYMRDAIRFMLPEVLGRPNLENYQKRALLRMNEYLMRHKLIPDYPQAQANIYAKALTQDLKP